MFIISSTPKNYIDLKPNKFNPQTNGGGGGGVIKKMMDDDAREGGGCPRRPKKTYLIVYRKVWICFDQS